MGASLPTLPGARAWTLKQLNTGCEMRDVQEEYNGSIRPHTGYSASLEAFKLDFEYGEDAPLVELEMQDDPIN